MDRKRTDWWRAVCAAVSCAVAVCGCAEFRAPRIDPTGQHVFAEPVFPTSPDYRQQPGTMQSWDPADLIVTPRVTVAPVGSEVVLVAGVRSQDQYLTTNERVEWTLDQGGVGEFVEVEKGTWCDLFLLDFTQPRKIDATHAVSSTSREYVRLTRGTPTPADDVCVLRGQAWITVTSPTEGTSYATAFAPSVYGWEQRKQTAMVHWVDAQWRFPPPAINPAGTRHVFTTAVMRQTDQAPCPGWRVRYQILDGPAAGFAPSGAPSVEVETDASGQASAEIFQRQPAPGTNRIDIQIIRPATPGGRMIVVGSGTTSKTWSAPGIGLRKTGPSVAGVGTTATYQIQVSNPGDLPADNVVVVDEIPDGMSYVGSNPAADLSGRTIQWRLGKLGAGTVRTLEVNLRADRPGSAVSCAEATATGGLKARQCVTTTVSLNALDLRISGPVQASVGDQVKFEIVVTNPSETSYGKLVIRDRFDDGLEHATSQKSIDRTLADVFGPRQSMRITVTLRVVKAGQWCHTVEILDRNTAIATARACLTAVQGPAAWPLAPPTTPSQPPLEPPGAKPSPGAPPTGAAAVSVKIFGPALRTVGETAEFTIDVTNTGGQSLTGVKVINEPSKELKATLATQGHQLQGNSLVWTIDTLLPGRTNRYQVQYECAQPAAQASNRARVTTQQGVQGDDQVFLRIGSTPILSAGGLTMAIASLHNPVTQGKELTFEIKVTHNGQAPDRNVVLEVAVPPQMIPVRLQTTGPEGLQYQIAEDQTIRFDPVPLVNPGQSLLYRIRLRAKEAGTVQLRAKLTSQNLSQPLVMPGEQIIQSP